MKIHPARNTARLSVEYAASVAPRIKRIPLIVGVSQSRLGTISVDARVRQEKSTISVWRNDSPVGAERSSSTLAATETSDVVNPRIRTWRRQAAIRIAPSQGAPIAEMLTADPPAIHGAAPII